MAQVKEVMKANKVNVVQDANKRGSAKKSIDRAMSEGSGVIREIYAKK